MRWLNMCQLSPFCSESTHELTAKRLASGLVLVVALAGCTGTVLGKDEPKSSAKSGSPVVKELWLVPYEPLTPAEKVFAQTLQGLVGRKQPRIWLDSGDQSRVILKQLREEGT